MAKINTPESDIGKIKSINLRNIMEDEEEQAEFKVMAEKRINESFNSLSIKSDTDRLENPKELFRMNTLDTDGVLPNLIRKLGGISTGTINAIVGIPSVGKSTFAMQLARGLSQNQPVFYFSYEMARTRLFAKWLSSELFINSGMADGTVTSNDLMKSENWDTERFNADGFKEAIKKAQAIGDRKLYPIDASCERVCINDIVRMAENYRTLHNEYPVIFIDYLNMLPSPVGRGGAELGTTKAIIDDALEKCRTLASNGATVFLISSLTKDSFKTEAGIESVAGSSDISYFCDCIIGLQYANPEKDIKAEQKKNPRELMAVIIKNRYFGQGERIKLSYYARHDYFDDAQTEEKEAERPAEKKEVPKKEAPKKEAPKKTEMPKVKSVPKETEERRGPETVRRRKF